MKKRNTRVKTTTQFISECLEKRGNIYDYSLVEYINSKTKINIICNIHGVFQQTPNNHLNKGHNCPICSDGYYKRKSNSEIIKDFKKTHGDKYNYNIVKYKDNKTKINIICNIHGVFQQTPNNHLKGQNCPICSKIDTKEFIKRANDKHMFKYDYKLTKYVNMNTKVYISCPNHGVFKQVPYSHLYGSGCPSCNDSKGEREIKRFLENVNIQYIPNHSFDGCKFKKKLRFDFYIPTKNICIEYDGSQHTKSVKYFGGDDQFKLIQKRDMIKNKYCTENNIILIRIPYKGDIKNILSNAIY
jgi:hypothetical protein